MQVTLIAAMDATGSIGSSDGGIPWTTPSHAVPRDRDHFRSYTSAQWMLVGRRTYEEMEGWFDTRIPIVLTRAKDFAPSLCTHRHAPSVPAAIKLADTNGAHELVVCGGAAVYEAALPHADRLVLTRIDADYGGDLYFPGIDDIQTSWCVIHRESWPADEANAHDMTLEILDRCP